MKYIYVFVAMLVGLVGSLWLSVAGAQVLVDKGNYLCGYGKIRSLTSYFYSSEPVVLVSTEWLPSWEVMKIDELPTRPRAVEMRGLGFGVRVANFTPENFFRRQEILSQAHGGGVTVGITAKKTIFTYGCSGALPEFLTIKLCRNPLDCCHGYLGCGKEQKYGTNRAASVTKRGNVTEEFYE